MSRVTPETRDPAYRAGGFALLVALGSILAALAIEHIGEIEPCPLCYQQRWAYYSGIPALFVGLVLVAADNKRAATLVFFLVALAFLANAGLGVYHTGVEWKLWAGPDTCAATPGELQPLGKALIDRLEKVRVVRCDEAPLHIFGLSLAGWNVVASFVVFTAALKAAFAASEIRSSI